MKDSLIIQKSTELELRDTQMVKLMLDISKRIDQMEKANIFGLMETTTKVIFQTV